MTDGPLARSAGVSATTAPPARAHGAPACGPATWLRVQGPDQRALCSRHKQEYLDREQLEGPREQR